jgi:hypothetical protein
MRILARRERKISASQYCATRLSTLLLMIRISTYGTHTPQKHGLR